MLFVLIRTTAMGNSWRIFACYVCEIHTMNTNKIFEGSTKRPAHISHTRTMYSPFGVRCCDCDDLNEFSRLTFKDFIVVVVWWTSMTFTETMTMTRLCEMNKTDNNHSKPGISSVITSFSNAARHTVALRAISLCFLVIFIYYLDT